MFTEEQRRNVDTMAEERSSLMAHYRTTDFREARWQAWIHAGFAHRPYNVIVDTRKHLGDPGYYIARNEFWGLYGDYESIVATVAPSDPEPPRP